MSRWADQHWWPGQKLRRCSGGLLGHSPIAAGRAGGRSDQAWRAKCKASRDLGLSCSPVLLPCSAAPSPDLVVLRRCPAVLGRPRRRPAPSRRSSVPLRPSTPSACSVIRRKRRLATPWLPPVAILSLQRPILTRRSAAASCSPSPLPPLCSSRSTAPSCRSATPPPASLNSCARRCHPVPSPRAVSRRLRPVTPRASTAAIRPFIASSRDAARLWHR